MVAGGSRGLGKSLAIELAKRGAFKHSEKEVGCGADGSGAHILLLARGKDALEAARAEVSSHRKSSGQVINAIATDLCDHLAVSPPAVNRSMSSYFRFLFACTNRSLGKEGVAPVRCCSRHYSLCCRWFQSISDWVSCRCRP